VFIVNPNSVGVRGWSIGGIMNSRLLAIEHPSDESLELYALGRLQDMRTAVLEDHLLVCTECQDRLADVDSYVYAMKQVCQETVAKAASKRPSFLAGVLAFPKPVWAGAFAALIICLSIPAVWRNSTVQSGTGQAVTEEGVTLVASRGFDNAGAANAHAGAPLRLNIDAAELGSYPAYEFEVVTASGSVVSHAQAKPNAATLSIQVPKGLNTGLYWVRVSTIDKQLLREFGLRVN
jgi:hypothetical protein